jgi:aldose 1-epimerase
MKKIGLLKLITIYALALSCGVIAKAQTAAPGDLLDKSAFETEIDGKPVSLYTITNGRITAQITNFGGYIVGIYTPDRDGNYTNVVGHNDNIQQYRTFSRNPVGSSLGRYANRIGHASFTIDGTEYNVTRNNGEHSLHGGSKGFDHTVWDVEEVKDDSVVLSCVLEDGLDGFPGTLKTFLTFSITEDDGVSVNYSATTDKPTVCNLSHHVYFNLNGFPADNVLDHVVYINADAITEVDSGLIPTGTILPVEGTPFDFRTPVALVERQVSTPAGRPAPGTPMPAVPEGMVRSYDQNFCLNHSGAGKMDLVASVYSPSSGRFMEVYNNQPGLQFFTGNRVAMALESQLYPDTPNHPEFPGNCAILRPGETYHHTVIYKFSTK